ncbi:MAG: GxxExxY protein [Spirochaetes bacterium]|nr:GxxExxY protein [Spirochaetota bacterium]
MFSHEKTQKNTKKGKNVFYKNNIVGQYYVDILINDRIIVELKIDEKVNLKHQPQLLNYLKATKIKFGLLISFGKEKCEYKRFVY